MKLYIFISFVIICTRVTARYEDMYVSPADSEITKAILLSTSTNNGRSFINEGYKYSTPNNGNNIATHNNKNNNHTPNLDGRVNSPQTNGGKSINNEGYYYSRNSTSMDDERSSNESFDSSTSHDNSRENLNNFKKANGASIQGSNGYMGYNTNDGYDSASQQNSKNNNPVRNDNENNNNLGTNSGKISKLRNSENFLDQEYRGLNQGYNTNNNNFASRDLEHNIRKNNKENSNYISNSRLNSDEENSNKDYYTEYRNDARHTGNKTPIGTNNKNNIYLLNIENNSQEQNRFTNSDNFLNKKYLNQNYDTSKNNIPFHINNENNNYILNTESKNNRLRNSGHIMNQEYSAPENYKNSRLTIHTNSGDDYKIIPRHKDSFPRRNKNIFESINQDHGPPSNSNQENGKAIQFRVKPSTESTSQENFNTFNQEYDGNNKISQLNSNNNNKYLPPPYIDDNISRPRNTDTSTDTINHGYDTINPLENNIPLSPPANTKNNGYNHETGRQQKQSQRQLKNEMHTSYFFTADNRQYNTGNNFQGGHLPNHPSISDAILKSWERDVEEFQEICSENEINCSTDAQLLRDIYRLPKFSFNSEYNY